MESIGKLSLSRCLCACMLAMLATTLATVDAALVINTWPFTEATDAAWRVLQAGGGAVDAVIEGCSTCERLQCDGSVGYGGSPDEAGETTLDALILDGTTMQAGAVGSLRSVRDAARAAALVMRHTRQTLLVGSQATAFALAMGLPRSNLTTPASAALWSAWRDAQCQPNYRVDVVPDPAHSCGPYSLPGAPTPTHSAAANPDSDSGSSAPLPAPTGRALSMARGLEGPADLDADLGADRVVGRAVPAADRRFDVGRGGHARPPHDTISMVVVEDGGALAAGTSTNGLRGKVPGRVGDAAIPGAAAYAVTGVGGCGATGDGDVMMRFLPCYQVVESMRLGMGPRQAAEDAMRRIMAYEPVFQGALVAVNSSLTHGGAAFGWTFTYSLRTDDTGTHVHTVLPLKAASASVRV